MTIKNNRFVIFEPTVLVAMDLEQCLREHDPQAEIVLAPTLGQALRMIAEGTATLAVLHTGADQVAATHVPVLLIGDRAEDRPGRQTVLMRPFSADDVAVALLTLGVRAGRMAA